MRLTSTVPRVGAAVLAVAVVGAAATLVTTPAEAATNADLAMLSLTDRPDPVTRTGVVAYTAQLRNLGPEDATDARVRFADPALAMPAGVSFVGGSVTSNLGGSGTCTQPEPGAPAICALGDGSIDFNPEEIWIVTVYLETSDSTPSSIEIRARATADVDPNTDNNELSQTTTVEPFGNDSTTSFVPPSNETITVATSATVLVNGVELPVAQPGDTTAAAISVPPGGPGGTVTVAEFDCEPPFCVDAMRTMVPTPTSPPFDNRVVQFIPPLAPYYDYLHPVRYTIAYDASVIGTVRPRNVTALYTKDSDPETLYLADRCPRSLTDSTEFPCLESAKVIKGKRPALKGDLLLVLLGTYNDPKIAGFR